MGRIAVALLVVALALGVAACGGDDDTDTATTEQTTTETMTAAGREIFVANCGTCHALSDAGTNGTIGPGLDGIGLDVSAVEMQVETVAAGCLRSKSNSRTRRSRPCPPTSPTRPRTGSSLVPDLGSCLPPRASTTWRPECGRSPTVGASSG